MKRADYGRLPSATAIAIPYMVRLTVVAVTVANTWILKSSLDPNARERPLQFRKSTLDLLTSATPWQTSTTSICQERTRARRRLFS